MQGSNLVPSVRQLLPSSVTTNQVRKRQPLRSDKDSGQVRGHVSVVRDRPRVAFDGVVVGGQNRVWECYLERLRVSEPTGTEWEQPCIVKTVRCCEMLKHSPTSGLVLLESGKHSLGGFKRLEQADLANQSRPGVDTIRRVVRYYVHHRSYVYVMSVCNFVVQQ